MSEVLAHVMRGKEVESIHRGNLAVLDDDNNIIYSVGDPYARTYWRSAAKPFQALPMIEAGGIERFGFDDEELAVMTASHGGEEGHVAKIKSILDKMGCGVEVLDCGVSAPLYWPHAREMIEKGEEFGQIHNPCSGKHSSMIALALIRGYDIKGYIKPDHPVQREMLDVVADIAGLDREDIRLGVDGCGVPVFGLPVYNMAVAYSKLSRPKKIKTPARRDALIKVGGVMTGNPYYVAGKSRFDTTLMETTKGRLVAKLGAEGVYCVGVMGEGIGIALKIDDGSSRAIGTVIIELLGRLGLLTDVEFNKLKDSCKTEITNHRREIIGEIKTVF
jgi:L-asparaginase II